MVNRVKKTQTDMLEHFFNQPKHTKVYLFFTQILLKSWFTQLDIVQIRKFLESHQKKTESKDLKNQSPRQEDSTKEQVTRN